MTGLKSAKIFHYPQSIFTKPCSGIGRGKCKLFIGDDGRLDKTLVTSDCYNYLPALKHYKLIAALRYATFFRHEILVVEVLNISPGQCFIFERLSQGCIVSRTILLILILVKKKLLI